MTGAGLIGAVTKLSKFTNAEFSPKKLCGVFLPDIELCEDAPSSSLFMWDRSNGSGVDSKQTQIHTINKIKKIIIKCHCFLYILVGNERFPKRLNSSNSWFGLLKG